ncbi:MAG: ATP-binding protein [Prolixibacteraceae bacterium]|nr:ATP-binding protein [Prolixibacteraceae bacterium]
MFLFNPDLGDNFIGRKKEIEFAIEQFRLGQNVFLTAPRRFGKTSFVYEIFKKLKSRNFFIAYVDVFTVTSINRFALEIIETLLENTGLEQDFRDVIYDKENIQKYPELKSLMNEYDFLYEFNKNSVDNYDLLGNCIDFIEQYSIKNRRRILFVFDEFGDYRKLDDGRLTKILKSKFKNHLNTSYLFTGSYDLIMNDLFEGIKAPFNRLARKITFAEINIALLKNFYKEQFEHHHIQVPESFTNSVIDFTNGHPYYSQLALQETIIYHLINQKLPEFDDLLERMVLSEKDFLEKTWEEIATSKQHIKTVLVLTKDKTGVYSSLRNSNVNIYRSLKTLLGNGTLIVGNDKNHRLSDPLLNLWIKKNVHKQGIFY